MGSFLQDVKYGARMLAKNPAFTIVALLTLALGIGANTAIFSAVNAILLRPLPYRDSGRLVNVWGSSAKYPGYYMTISVPEFNDVQSQNHSFERMAAFRRGTMNWTGHGRPEVVTVTQVSSSFFPTLGVSAFRGRLFTTDDETFGKDRVVLLSDALWKSRFAADPAILGKSVRLDDQTYSIIGILPPGFQFGDSGDNLPQIYKPYAPDDKVRQEREQRGIFVIARLRRGVSPHRAQIEMRTIAARMAQAYPEEDEGQGLTVMTLKQGVVLGVQTPLLVLLAAVGFVLLIACVNVANLFLARSWQRHREMAVRAALGATRARIIRQLLVESVLLAVAGGAAGLIIGTWGIDVVRRLAPADTARLAEIGFDRAILWFTLGISLLTGIVFGLAPALQASRPDLNAELKAGTATSGSGSIAKGHHRFRSLLVVSEVALAVLLLIGSGLMLKSFSRLLTVNPGFRLDHAVTADLSLPEEKYKTREERIAFFENVLNRMSQIPGVQSAAVVTSPLLSGMINMSNFAVEGQPTNDPHFEPYLELQNVSPNYFQTAGITFISGRNFDDSDNATSPKVVIVNQTLASRYWPSGSAVGKRLSIEQGHDGHARWSEIIAVVKDTRDVDLSSAPKAEVYTPLAQHAASSMSLLVRSQLPTNGIEASIRDAVESVDRDQPVGKMTTLEQAIALSVAEPRFRTQLLGIFAALGLALTLVGIFGVISYSVSQRTREIGIRMALGAQGNDVLREALWGGMKLALTGLAIGMIAALALTRLMTSLLFDVRPVDLPTYAAVAVLLSCVALAACDFPARRATKVDPLVALRYE
ncbi:MAG: ABC transporter permease [Candidatus Acidiferrales bacterium]